MPADFLSLPNPESIRIIDFDVAEIVPIPFGHHSYVLVVSGTKPFLNMRVQLSPRIYIEQPEYWGIEVLGDLSGFGLPALGPYTVTLPLNDLFGSKGIEVIGANTSKKLDRPY
ncbi:hypothetical protein [Streptomyces katsurahamanus]|uniref:Uncharacterized protein n=1 Tax=Streptomyces katsurahamanus TaxID=2577098 RepID=A0ABW9P0C3_9ACTN|nr:hypothetical protein [Streptomyces katsurahamanus]MQS39003.1 hypothetical protein [Streptomyces katsurahamanus]